MFRLAIFRDGFLFLNHSPAFPFTEEVCLFPLCLILPFIQNGGTFLKKHVVDHSVEVEGYPEGSLRG